MNGMNGMNEWNEWNERERERELERELERDWWAWSDPPGMRAPPLAKLQCLQIGVYRRLFIHKFYIFSLESLLSVGRLCVQDVALFTRVPP